MLSVNFCIFALELTNKTMKKLLFLLLTFPLFIACSSDDEKDNTEKEQEENYEYYFTLRVGDIPAKDISITLMDKNEDTMQYINGVNISSNSSQSFTTKYPRIRISFRQGSNLYYSFPASYSESYSYQLKKSSNTISLNRQISTAK